MYRKRFASSPLVACACVAIVGFCSVARSFAGDLSGIPGIFVDIGYGARPMGIGGAYVALADDANSILWNPAGLTNLDAREATLMYTNQMSLVPYYFMAYGQRFMEDHAHGEALIYSGDSVLSETTIIVAYAYSAKRLLLPPLDRLRAGACLKIRLASFGNNPDGGEDRSQGSGFGLGFDLGIQWQATDRLAVGLLIRDLLNTVSYNNSKTGRYSEAVPLTLTLGLALLNKRAELVESNDIKHNLTGLAARMSPGLVFAIDLDKSLYHDTEDVVRFGTERVLFDLLALRGGLSQTIGPEINRTYSLGFGLKYEFEIGVAVKFDFTYLFQEINNTPRVSTTVVF